jgi:hypothetical protein
MRTLYSLRSGSDGCADVACSLLRSLQIVRIIHHSGLRAATGYLLSNKWRARFVQCIFILVYPSFSLFFFILLFLRAGRTHYLLLANAMPPMYEVTLRS